MNLDNNINILIDGMIGFYSHKVEFNYGCVEFESVSFEFYPEILN